LAEALEHVRRDSRVDLLVTDYHLGDGELGTQVITHLRRALGPQLKAVLMTGDTSSAMQKLPPDDEARQQAGQCGRTAEPDTGIPGGRVTIACKSPSQTGPERRAYLPLLLI